MKRDDGFTLVELLIAISLLGIVMGALISAMILSLRTVDATRQKITDTTGAQLVTSWLVGDAQSAQKVNPSASCDSSSDNLLELRWTDAADNTTITDVVYTAETADATNMQLSRVVYAVSGASCTQTAKEQLVRDISTTGSATVAVCSPACDDSATRVGLHVTAFSTQPNSTQYSSYTFEVYGSRRAS
jgi:prepilin-type N-terminal cleavage/methylation domain-containing protein